MLLSPEARCLVYRELWDNKQPRVWRYGLGDVLLIGA
jgi:hypothetical protein